MLTFRFAKGGLLESLKVIDDSTKEENLPESQITPIDR